MVETETTPEEGELEQNKPEPWEDAVPRKQGSRETQVAGRASLGFFAAKSPVFGSLFHLLLCRARLQRLQHADTSTVLLGGAWVSMRELCVDQVH